MKRGSQEAAMISTTPTLTRPLSESEGVMWRCISAVNPMSCSA
jgi:hypothetical protein